MSFFLFLKATLAIINNDDESQNRLIIYFTSITGVHYQFNRRIINTTFKFRDSGLIIRFILLVPTWMVEQISWPRRKLRRMSFDETALVRIRAGRAG